MSNQPIKSDCKPSIDEVVQRMRGEAFLQRSLNEARLAREQVQISHSASNRSLNESSLRNKTPKI